MAQAVEYGVAVQEDEFADERVVGRTTALAEAVDAVRRMPFSRRYLVQRTASGWAEVPVGQPSDANPRL